MKRETWTPKAGTTRVATRAGILSRISKRAAATVYLSCWASILLAQSSDRDRIGTPPRAMAAILADRHVPDSAYDVHRRALLMKAEDRFSYLISWVLPGESHDTFRVSLDFTPTHPAPPASEIGVTDARRRELAKQRGETRVQTGGNLVSPVLDLIAVSSELDRLAQLRTRVEGVFPQNSVQQRARLSLLALIDIASGDFDTALRDLDELFPLIEANSENTISARAAELLAIHCANDHPQTRSFARDAATNLCVRYLRDSGRGTLVAWESHLLAIMATTRHFDREPSASADAVNVAAEMSLQPKLIEWSPATRTTASSRGSGHSRPHWQRFGERIENTNGHKDDFLYYHIPLQGNFQVECDLQTRDYQNTQMVVGGQWAESLFFSRNHYEFGDLRERLSRANVEPILTKYNSWVHLRATVRDQVVTHYVNGRLLHRVEVQGDVDPWVVLRSEDRHDGGAADIRITGEPVIPKEIRMTASGDLTGWFPYFPGQVGKPKATWQQLGDVPSGGGIVAPRRTDLAGMNVERLLRYHRPMLEDGTIEYEFFYRAGVAHVHPAIDRLVFLLEPEGVRIHWVTDGEFDRTELAPGNVFDEPAQRRGPEKLPLLENDWNRLRLTLEGDTASLYVNEQLIYQRDLETTNQRSFGLFHYSDRTEARVRNVRWRGAWPRDLPPVAKQELANHDVHVLDERLPDLTTVVKHDFAKDGFPPEKLTVVNSRGGAIEQASEGMRVDRPGGQGYVQTSLEFNLIVAGDFDVVAAYQQFDARPGADATSTVGLRMPMSEVNSQQCLVLRRLVRVPKQEDRHVIQAIGRNGTTAADLDWKTFYNDAHESNSGRLRLARRGGRVYYLVAEGESPNFRLIGETDTTSDSLPRQCIQLFAQSAGDGGMRVIWRDVVIRAEKLTYVPSNSSSQAALSVMSDDGTNLRQLLPKESGITGPGSPAWSPDANLVAFDVYNGSTATSRMYVVNADGTNLRDLGVGNMPTFSPDGKRIAFSWGGNGIAVMHADGTNREVLDSSGWGAQWSPDGRIAFARGGNVALYDLKTKTQQEILEGEHASRYSYLYWNLGCSRDGKRVCFKAQTRRDSQYEIAVAAVAGSRQEFQVLYANPKEMSADFSWHPDDHRILFCLDQGRVPRLFTLDRRNPGPPQLLPGQPPNHSIIAADWSADGKQIVIVSQTLPDLNSVFGVVNEQ